MAARGDALQRQAEELQVRFEEAFWCEEIGTYALALDGAKCLQAHMPLFERAKENAADLDASMGYRKEGVHRSHSQPVHDRHRILDGKWTRRNGPGMDV